jgi:adenylate kinase family enzyme
MFLAALMRIVVIGSSGAGKTVLSRTIAARLGLPHIEVDAINFQAGWIELLQKNPDEFGHHLARAVEAEAWVVDGPYGPALDRVWERATHLVWLDYERPVVIIRLIRRSLLRVILRTKLWAGNREQWRRLLHSSHPLHWVWGRWAWRRRDTEERLRRPEFARLVVLRLHRPKEAKKVVEILEAMRRSSGALGRCGHMAPTKMLSRSTPDFLPRSIAGK